MSRVCEICGKKPMVGNNVSHAHNKTKRRWHQNRFDAGRSQPAAGASHQSDRRAGRLPQLGGRLRHQVQDDDGQSQPRRERHAPGLDWLRAFTLAMGDQR